MAREYYVKNKNREKGELVRLQKLIDQGEWYKV